MNRSKEHMIQGYSRAVPVADFLSLYMKGAAAPPWAKINQIATKSKAQLKRTAGKIKKNTIELKMYDTFIDYVNKVVEDFPAATRPSFENTSSVTFKRLDPTDHDSRPDVASPLPGLQPPKICKWHHTGTAIEFKVKDDAFEADGGIKSGQVENLVQLLQNARCILMSSGCCYAFVVSVFRNQARLFRVDCSGYIVTDAFDWSKEDKFFPEFYWRLYNGAKGGRLLGHDATISLPTPAEKLEMHRKLQKLPQYSSLSFEEATARSRWVKVKVGGDLKRAFTFGEPIFQSEGLFGRGTRVDRVLIEGETHPQVYAMKDAWREACRRPESDFYEVIQNYIDTEYPGEAAKGLATCVGSVDLSTLHSDHKNHYSRAARRRRSAFRSMPRLLALHSSRFPLDKFQSTKQFVQALRNAIAGHQLALMAGVLHRDISEGNVLINENHENRPLLPEAGFLLDFDYSQFTPEGLARFRGLHPDLIMAEIDKNLKDITGTFPFMSLASLAHMQQQLDGSQPEQEYHHSCKDDLEGFYWLLVRLILLHTDHNVLGGPKACSSIFDGQVFPVINQKIAWLSNLSIFVRSRLPVKNHAPLTQLVEVLTPMFHAQYMRPPVDVTHDSLLAVFDEALRSEGWPANDFAREIVLPPSTSAYWREAVKRTMPVPRVHSQTLPLPAVQVPGSVTDSSRQKRKRATVDVAPEGEDRGRRRSKRLNQPTN
ncbi:hypothetical protein B0H11DRAFT_2285757 [Mycena galericulata]|nr:hypothetical protein B0H11DRAFT_2285757 [Mycena galericulata]